MSYIVTEKKCHTLSQKKSVTHHHKASQRNCVCHLILTERCLCRCFNWCQFYQHFLRAFIVQKFGAKSIKSVNFTNVLNTDFALVDPESVRTHSSCQYHFTLLGSTSVKAVRRTLMKLTPKHCIAILAPKFCMKNARKNVDKIDP